MAKADETTESGAGGGNADLAVGDGSFHAFTKQMGERLRELRNSPASHSDMRTAAITSDAYGDFPRAQPWRRSTQGAIPSGAFSRILGEQIEALGITVEVSENGYDNVEAETLRGMRDIQRNVLHQYQYQDAPPPQPRAIPRASTSTTNTSVRINQSLKIFDMGHTDKEAPDANHN